MDDTILRNKIEAARLEGWSEGYNEGMLAAYEYVVTNVSNVDVGVIDDLKLAIKLCGGEIE